MRLGQVSGTKDDWIPLQGSVCLTPSFLRHTLDFSTIVTR